MEGPFFSYNSDLHHFVAPFIGALEGLPWQGEAQMKNLFPDIEATVKNKLDSILEKLTQCHSQREQVRRLETNQDDWKNENCACHQYSQTQKKKIIELQDHLGQYCSFLAVFACNSAKLDLNLVKTYLPTILVNE